jgi:hypothetical protein
MIVELIFYHKTGDGASWQISTIKNDKMKEVRDFSLIPPGIENFSMQYLYDDLKTAIYLVRGHPFVSKNEPSGY